MQEKTRNALRRSWIRLRLLVEGHLLNPVWDGAEKHRRRHHKAFARILTGFMQKHYLEAARSVVPAAAQVPAAGEEKIFSIWLQGEDRAPDLVKACFRSIRHHCTEELVVLDQESLPRYISLPAPITEKYKAGKIRACHYADICRVELLHTYGGYWLDATCFVTAPIPEFIREQDFFVYLAGDRVHGNYSYIQNCFIRARKGAYLLEAWRAMILDYWLHEDTRVEYFQHQLMFRTLVGSLPAAREAFAAMPQVDQYPTHLYLYEYKDRPYDPEVFRRASEEGFFYQKTTYKGLENIIPGSFAHHILHWEEPSGETVPARPGSGNVPECGR